MSATTITINPQTVERMRLASMSIGVRQGRTFKNDDQRLNALLDQISDNNLTPAVQDATGDTTPSPR